jgi:hypothetical protein
MGQYHIVVNLDKKQFLHPHRLGDGLKLMEFGCSQAGTMTALALLLAEDNGRGGGDFGAGHELVGSWARDRIAICGDYGDNDESGQCTYMRAHEEFEDISSRIRSAMAAGDEWLASELREVF